MSNDVEILFRIREMMIDKVISIRVVTLTLKGPGGGGGGGGGRNPPPLDFSCDNFA